jgi:hypothetical protein
VAIGLTRRIFLWLVNRFMFLTAVPMKNTYLWDVTECNLVEIHRRFGGTSLPQTSELESKPRKQSTHSSTMNIEAVRLKRGKLLPDYTASYSGILFIVTTAGAPNPAMLLQVPEYAIPEFSQITSS